MNRKQRRAAGTKSDPSQLRNLSKRLVQANRPADADPSRRYLMTRIRPVTIADMIPGYEYGPDITILEVELPAVPGQPGALWQMPVEVPEELRNPTPENAQAVYAIVYSCDPEARAIIDELCALARPWREVQASRSLPQETLGRIVLPPPHPEPSTFPRDAGRRTQLTS